MQWTQVLTIILANVGLSVTLFLWLRKESNAERREFTKAIIDFHGRLERQDAEFKAHFMHHHSTK